VIFKAQVTDCEFQNRLLVQAEHLKTKISSFLAAAIFESSCLSEPAASISWICKNLFSFFFFNLVKMKK
jgi:hypothetical protein